MNRLLLYFPYLCFANVLLVKSTIKTDYLYITVIIIYKRISVQKLKG